MSDWIRCLTVASHHNRKEIYAFALSSWENTERALDLQQPTAFTLYVCVSCIGLTDWLFTVTAEKWRSQRVDKQGSLEYFILIGQSRHPAACFFLINLTGDHGNAVQIKLALFQAVMGEKKLFKTLNQFNQLLCKTIHHLKHSKQCFWSIRCKWKVNTNQTSFFTNQLRLFVIK